MKIEKLYPYIMIAIAIGGLVINWNNYQTNKKKKSECACQDGE
jgi:nitrate reductase gamma subunit